MIKNNLIILSLIGLSFISCNNKNGKIENIRKGELNPTVELIKVEEKKFILDSNTAPQPQYTQLYQDSSDKRKFTFLNTYTNSIYFYDYETAEYIREISYDKEGPNGIQRPMGYLIKNLDSIYIFDQLTNSLILSNDDGKVKNKISLIGDKDPKNTEWSLSYPQYYPLTVAPLIETPQELLFTGMYAWAIPDSLLEKFHFTSRIDLSSSKVSFGHGYPATLYGSEFNWDDPIYTAVYSDLHPDGNKLIYSFPVSHDLYLANLDSSLYKTFYGGSNFAGTISSLEEKKSSPSHAEMGVHIAGTDLYGGIKYDKYRKVYYRFLRNAMSDVSKDSNWKEKPLSVIIMDKDFNYLGETNIGTLKNYNWENSFVSKEGLNIEYLHENDINEVYLSLHIFVPEEI